MKLDIGHRHPNLTEHFNCDKCGNRFIDWRKEKREREAELDHKKKWFQSWYGINAKYIRFMKPDFRKKFGQKYGPRNKKPGE